MALTLFFHPFSSYCQKVVMALYENATPFTPKIIDLGDPASRAELAAAWPMAKFPVLRDDARGETIPESSVIVEYLAHHYPGPVKLIPSDPDAALKVRARDRFFDFYINDALTKVVIDHFRPPGARDPHGVEMAKQMMTTAYGILETDMAGRTWSTGDAFTMADCAAAPMLFYGNLINPFGAYPNIVAFYNRLTARPRSAAPSRKPSPTARACRSKRPTGRSIAG